VQLKEEPTKPAESSEKEGSANEGQAEDLPAKIDQEAEFEKLAKSIPPPARAFMMQMTRMSGSPFPHPIFEKFKPEHVEKFLEYSHKENENRYLFLSSNRYFYFGYALLFVAVLVFLIVYLAPFHKDLLGDILKMLAVFAGGFGAGLGAKSFLGKKD